MRCGRHHHVRDRPSPRDRVGHLLGRGQYRGPARIADPDRVQGVKAIGVDEHVWRPSRTSAIEMGRI